MTAPSRRIAVIPVDGIGTEVVPAGVAALEATADVFVVPDHVSLWGSLLQFRRTFDQYVRHGDDGRARRRHRATGPRARAVTVDAAGSDVARALLHDRPRV